MLCRETERTCQQQADRLLWCCDFNAVRGEDSFVRALWAGRPLLWHIYQQFDAAHLHKLQAFLALYQQGLSAPAVQALGDFWTAWNQNEGLAPGWTAMCEHWAELCLHARNWSIRQAAQQDLATGLAKFCANWL